MWKGRRQSGREVEKSVEKAEGEEGKRKWEGESLY
jgi:hypothetical protein